jgi:hypothetical protein
MPDYLGGVLSGSYYSGDFDSPVIQASFRYQKAGVSPAFLGMCASGRSDPE